MEIRHFLKEEKLRVPQKVAYHYHRKGLICDPLTESCKQKLRTWNETWDDRLTIGCMMARLTKEEREKLSITWDMNRAETWAYSRFFNCATTSKLATRYPPRAKVVSLEVQKNFGYEIPENRLKEIQDKARRQRFLNNKKKKTKN